MAKSLTSQLGLGLAVKQNTPVSPIVVNTPPPSKLDQIRAVNQSKQSLNSLVSGLGSDITAIES